MSLVTDPNIVKAAMLYFAKFPTLANVTAVFKRKPGTSSFTGYDALQTEIAALTENSLVPEIKGFVFGPDENVLKRQIEDLGGEMFLFLDYGNITSAQDQITQRKTDEFNLSVTIARPYKPEEQDIPEMVLLGDETLNAMRKIRAQMIADQQCSPFMKQILFPHEIFPWYARDLANSQGWTMVLQRQGVGML